MRIIILFDCLLAVTIETQLEFRIPFSKHQRCKFVSLTTTAEIQQSNQIPLCVTCLQNTFWKNLLHCQENYLSCFNTLIIILWTEQSYQRIPDFNRTPPYRTNKIFYLSLKNQVLSRFDCE